MKGRTATHLHYRLLRSHTILEVAHLAASCLRDNKRSQNVNDAVDQAIEILERVELKYEEIKNWQS